LRNVALVTLLATLTGDKTTFFTRPRGMVIGFNRSLVRLNKKKKTKDKLLNRTLVSCIGKKNIF
jgi:hypothetical protein